MIKGELEELEKLIMETVVTRRKLGGYNSEAETILTLSETMLKVIQHLREQVSRKK